jgi:hypothetical protein
LFGNIDADCFFHTPLDGREGNTGEAADRYVDRLAEARVRMLLVNTTTRRTNYRAGNDDALHRRRVTTPRTGLSGTGAWRACSPGTG